MVVTFHIKKYYIIKLMFITIFIATLVIIYKMNKLYIKNCVYSEKIDVVYTWVNGSDPRFIRNLNEYVKSTNASSDYSKQRFDDKYELKFSLRSIEKYANWLNHVYIVTNGQIPYWLNLDCDKLTIITHSQIFDNLPNLPTFSSPAIEKNLHKIPNLSKRFIYFNDDIFLSSETYLDDFYSPNWGFSVYLSWPVPNCAPNCLWMYVNDGQCDLDCYKPECQMDGTDCDDIVTTTNNIKTLLINNRQTNISKLVRDYNESIIRRRRKSADNNRSIDAYSASLQHSNRIFNVKYGFKMRKVPAHAPILIDSDVMSDLESKFRDELGVTESNRVRKNDDMQFSFTYYHFLMSEMVDESTGAIFDKFDTDFSRTWSDREIRTLLTQLYDVPLTYNTVVRFESILIDCYNNRKVNEGNAPTAPPYERYINSKLPTITKKLVQECANLSKILVNKFGKSPKYKHKEIRNSDKFVTFVMLNSNASDVVGNLDEIRRTRKKFVCLNDNLDESKESENELIKSILYDFYLSLFPIPSKFELPSDVRNKFAYVDELNEWKRKRNAVKVGLYCLISITLLIVCSKKIRYRIRNIL